MTVFVLCADRGIPPDGTKGAAAHLRGWCSALAATGTAVVTFTARASEGGFFPTPLRPLPGMAALDEESDRSGPPAWVYERYTLGHTAGLSWAQSRGVPFVLEVNAPLVDEATEHRPQTVQAGDEQAEKRLLAEADLVVCVSNPLAQWIAQRRGDRPTIVVPNGADPHHHRLMVREPLQEPTLVFLGHPKPWHGSERLIPLLVQLDRRDIPARLLVVGGGPGAENVRQAANDHGVAERVTITGPLDAEHVGLALSRSDVSVAPYPPLPFFYFCPLKILDSMMAGLPVVSTAQGDIPALIGRGGLTVRPEDDGALVDAVARLLRDHELRQELGRCARHRALQEFTWEATVRRFLKAARPHLGRCLV